MEKAKYYFRRIPSLLVAITLIALTIFTGLASVSKVAGSFVKNTEISVPEVKGSQSENSTVLGNSEEVELNGSGGSSESSDNNSLTQQLSPTLTPTAAVLQADLIGSLGASSSISNTGKCVITVFGKQYDVTSLQTTHPGGNIFVCGADNTSAYQGAHGTDVSRMAPYLLVTSTTSTSGSVSGTSASRVSPTPKLVNTISEEELEEEKQEFENALEQAKNNLENEREENDD